MAESNVIKVTDADFSQQVLQSDLPVLVDFTAQWCAPCKAILPSVEALATAYQGKVKVAKVDVDESQATAEQFGIRSMPTLLFFKGGKVVGHLVGAVPKAKLEAALLKVI